MSLLISTTNFFLRKYTLFNCLVLSLFCIWNKALAIDSLLPFFFMNKTYTHQTTLPFTIKDIIYNYMLLTTNTEPNINPLDHKKQHINKIQVSRDRNQAKETDEDHKTNNTSKKNEKKKT